MCEPAKERKLNNLTSENRKFNEARIEMECYACLEAISPGQTYHSYTKFIVVSCYSHVAHCLRCWKIIEAIWARAGKGIAVRLRLDCGETWESAFEEDPPKEVAALAFALPGDFQDDEKLDILDESKVGPS